MLFRFIRAFRCYFLYLYENYARQFGKGGMFPCLPSKYFKSDVEATMFDEIFKTFQMRYNLLHGNYFGTKNKSKM